MSNEQYRKPSNTEATKVVPIVPQNTPQTHVRHRRSDKYHGENEPQVNESNVQSGNVPTPKAAEGRTPAVRPAPKPVDAPGYTQVRPRIPGDTGREQLSGASYAVHEGTQESHPKRPVRVAPEYQEPLPNVSGYQDDQPPRRTHGCLVAILVFILVVVLAAVGIWFFLPEGDTGFVGTLNKWKDAITGTTDKVITRVDSVNVTPTSGQAPLDLVFSVQTSKDVTNIRLIDKDGLELYAEDVKSTANESGIIWTIKMRMAEAYEGSVSVSLLVGEEWQDAMASADVSVTPTVVQPAPTSVPTATPASTATPLITQPPVEETQAPIQTPTQAPVVITAAPVVTPAPTVIPTATPIPTDTPTPTDEPTPDPTSTPVPTDTPVPTATPMPALAAVAADSALPASLNMTQTVYQGTKAASDYNRALKISIPEPDAYAAWDGGVLTFRNNNFRQNAAFGTAEVQKNVMSVVWQQSMGYLSGSSDTYYGAGWTGQAAIVKWPIEIRQMMNIYEEKKAVTALKEVILAAQDGKIYFYDLATGEATRDAIDMGYPLRGSVSLNPRSIPLLAVGQGISKLRSSTGKIGYRVYSLLDNSEMYLLNGRDDNAYYTNGAFTGTALFDSTSDTMIVASGSGLLYTVDMSTAFDFEGAALTIKPTITKYRSIIGGEDKTLVAVRGSVAMYNQYAFYGDAYGVLQCVDLNTQSCMWAIDTGDATDATVALDFDDYGTLCLYTANILTNRRGTKGECNIRAIDAMTGEIMWEYTVPCTYNKSTHMGAKASPVVGQNSIGNLVIFTVSTSTTSGKVIAINKTTGNVVWSTDLDTYSWSSPVAVYNENGDAVIIQADHDGKLYMLDGQTGAVLSILQLEGNIDASPSVYNDMLVIGTSGKNSSYVYGIQIK